MMHATSSTIMHKCECIMVHMEMDMKPASTLSAQIRSIVAAALSESGMGLRRFEATKSLPAWSLRGIMDPSREQSPSVDRAAQILAALGYELEIRPREPAPAAPYASRNPAKSARFRRVTPEPEAPDFAASAPGPGPGPGPGETFERVADRHVAEILAAFADEYDAADGRTREALRIRFWHAYPDLRERERRLDRALGWLGWRVVAGRDATSQSN